MNHFALPDKLRPLLDRLFKLRFTLFLILALVVFGYVGWNVYAAISVVPDQATISSAAGSSPHINQQTVSHIRQLQDNNVGVRALFDQARQNPFQE